MKFKKHEGIVFNRKLSKKEYNQVMKYLSKKYNLKHSSMGNKSLMIIVFLMTIITIIGLLYYVYQNTEAVPPNEEELLYCYEAENCIVDDNNNIVILKDKSKNGNHLIQLDVYNRPKFSTDSGIIFNKRTEFLQYNRKLDSLDIKK